MIPRLILEELNLQPYLPSSRSNGMKVFSPIDGNHIGTVPMNDPQDVAATTHRACVAFKEWRKCPPPRRGDLIRLFGQVLRQNKDALGALVTLECGKIYEEGKGEVQEMIDICDFAVGLSRQLYGLTIASERPAHRMMETWHPLGPVGVITAFNFPVAVWAWNLALAVVCGNPVIWKPSEKTPLTALACQSLFSQALSRFGEGPSELSQVLMGGRDQVGTPLVSSPHVPLISATGSTRMGQEVAPQVAARFGRTILELGGNNAMIVCPSADLEMAQRAIVFSAVGTAGQRCTSLRRLFVHEDIYDTLIPNLKAAYTQIKMGNPFQEDVLMGPLIDGNAHHIMDAALEKARNQGGCIFGGQRISDMQAPQAFYVKPALVEMPAQTEIVQTETFAPILYIMKYRDFDKVLDTHNTVTQGLSSCIFTNHMREAETFVSPWGSDCGIANVNIGPSGAEIGGAFGGEKETGGGRESGSDAWKSYMRRQTNTINFSNRLPLAQGITFDTKTETETDTARRGSSKTADTGSSERESEDNTTKEIG